MNTKRFSITFPAEGARTAFIIDALLGNPDLARSVLHGGDHVVRPGGMMGDAVAAYGGELTETETEEREEGQ